ncbi:MAG: copper resistance protein B [Pseudomonadota bacterium]
MFLAGLSALFALGAVAQESTGQSQLEHVPPDPPQSRMHEMSYREMAQMMGMDDRKLLGKAMLDRLEWRDTAASEYLWDASAWYGGDFNKLWFESEGAHAASADEARVELLWDHIASAWWSTRLGLRQDLGDGPARSWLAFGVAGMTPGFIDLEAMAYVADDERAALRIAADYDLLLTQRLILHPEALISAYSRDDPERLIGTGLSNLELGVRLRYEIRREFSPYVGVNWSRRFGDSAKLARAAGEDPDEVTFVAGVRAWF